ncbi:hypothetical protein N7453_003395 [Penicillium expansum]|nr:hypothetical protein N7453_003395 [Penicillium expansum]
MKFYPKAREQRPSIHHPSVRPRRLGLLKAASVNFLLLQILFLGLFCWIFGALFQQSGHIHNINVLFVDYDGGAIGDAARVAFQKLKGPGFPTFVERSPSEYPQPGSIEGAVCDIKYWGALYTTANASNALSAAFAGGSAASSYDKNNVLTMVWNEVRYPTVVDSALADSMKLLSETARVAYSQTNAKEALKSVNTSDPAALAAFYEPWTLADNNILPTSQGSRAIYNTLVIILILIQEFFYLGTVNGLYAQFKLYTSLSPHRIVIARQLISLVYTLVGAMCTAGAIWAFRSGWDVNGNQFALTWLALWLFAHLNFLVLRRFYHLASAPLRTNGADIWASPYQHTLSSRYSSTSGLLVATPQLYFALPVLFVYEILGITLSSIGVYRRAHYAGLSQEKEEKGFQERVAAALREQQEAQMIRRETMHDVEGSGTSDSEDDPRGAMQRRSTATTTADQAELVNIISREMSRSKADRPDTARESTGPSFALAYKF